MSAAAGLASGRAAQVAQNAVLGQALDSGLLDPGAMALDAASAGAGPTLRAAQGIANGILRFLERDAQRE